MPDLTGGKSYADYTLHRAEWELLELMREVLKVRSYSRQSAAVCSHAPCCFQELREAQANFSSETSPTVWRAIPILECVQERWEIMAKNPRFAPVEHGIEAGLKKLQKYYRDLDQSDMYFICLGEFLVWRVARKLTISLCSVGSYHQR